MIPAIVVPPLFIIWGIAMVIVTITVILVARHVFKLRAKDPPEVKIRRLAKKRHIDLETASKAQMKTLVRDALGCTELEARDLVNAVSKK